MGRLSKQIEFSVKLQLKGMIMSHAAKYTKGPWEAFTEDNFSGWWAIRQVTDDGLNHEIGSTDGGFEEVDARLIASAPELLEALQELLCDGDVREVITTYQYELYKTLIAKALGG